MEITARRDVAAPAAVVWDVVTDIHRAPQVLSAVEDIEWVTDTTGIEVGARWRETRTMFGKRASEEMEVVSLDAGHRYTVVAASGSTTYHSTLTVTPHGDDRCELTMTFAGQSSGPVARVMAATVGRLFAGATRRALQQDLDDLAAEAEQHSAS